MSNDRIVDHWSTLLLRLFLGVMLFFAGLGKMMGGLGGFRKFIAERFSESFLPPPLLSLFSHVLPFVEVTLGALLLLGLFTRFALLAAGLTLITLFFGMWIVKEYQTAAQNALYVLIAVWALRHCGENRFSLDTLILPKK